MKPIDYEYWFKFDYWTFEQAAYLFSNINPNDENQIAYLNSHKSWTVSDKSSSSYPEQPNSIRQFTEYLQVLKSADLSEYKGSVKFNDKALVSDIFEIAISKRLNINSNLQNAWECSDNNPNKLPNVPKQSQNQNQNQTNDSGSFGMDMINAFDSLPISGIAKLFLTACSRYDEGKWRYFASKATSNGLLNARTSISRGSAESLFNPVQVANWLIDRGDIKPEHARRILKNNIPDRSNNLLEDLFGYE